MIAIPNFISGAMEHWGLIGYREVNMLYDVTQASAANKQRVAVVVAHEIAHMVCRRHNQLTKMSERETFHVDIT